MSGQAAGLTLLRCRLGDTLPNSNRFIRHHLATSRLAFAQGLACIGECPLGSNYAEFARGLPVSRETEAAHSANHGAPCVGRESLNVSVNSRHPPVNGVINVKARTPGVVIPVKVSRLSASPTSAPESL